MSSSLHVLASPQVADYLKREGVPAAPYHAGLSEKNRQSLQTRWMGGSDFRVLVATVAFGLGVDSPHVRFVAHFSMPKTIEGESLGIGFFRV